MLHRSGGETLVVVVRYIGDGDGTSWHLRIVLKPLNPEFKPIVLTVNDEGTVNVVAELVEVMGV